MGVFYDNWSDTGSETGVFYKNGLNTGFIWVDFVINGLIWGRKRAYFMKMVLMWVSYGLILQ